MTDAYHEQVKQQLEQARRTIGALMAQVQQLGGLLKDTTADRDRLAAVLRAAEDELGQWRRGEALTRQQALAERYRLAWRSARRRAAAADAELATLESNEAWRSAWPFSAVLPIWEPESLGAAFGAGRKSWWAVRWEEDRQRDLVQQRVADQLPVTPEPMALPSEEQMRERVRQTLGVTAVCDHRNPKRLGARPGDLALVCACGTEVFPSPIAEPRLPHECRIWEADGEWNVSCDVCPEYRFDMGSEHDCEVWADDHAAEVRP